MHRSPETIVDYVMKRSKWIGANFVASEHPWFAELDTLKKTALREGRNLVSFANYDYLGIGNDPRVAQAAHEAIEQLGVGAQASRIVGGERSIHRTLERDIADFLNVDDSLVLVSGYLANASLIGHLLTTGDLILIDEFSHNSIITGTRSSGAKVMTFRHNDVDHLDAVLAKNRPNYRRCLIIVESLYSMDGDVADLERILTLKDKHHAWLMVDEAHSIGVMGQTGRGLTEAADIDPKRVELIVGTLSKTFVTSGGFIAAQKHVVSLLRFTLPGFVYSVGQSPALTASAIKALEILRQEPERVRALQNNSQYFLNGARGRGLETGTAVGCAVIPIIYHEPQQALAAAQSLLQQAIYCPPIVQIGVPRDRPRLRFFMSAAHQKDDIDRALDILGSLTTDATIQTEADAQQKYNVAI